MRFSKRLKITAKVMGLVMAANFGLASREREHEVYERRNAKVAYIGGPNPPLSPIEDLQYAQEPIVLDSAHAEKTKDGYNVSVCVAGTELNIPTDDYSDLISKMYEKK